MCGYTRALFFRPFSRPLVCRLFLATLYGPKTGKPTGEPNGVFEVI